MKKHKTNKSKVNIAQKVKAINRANRNGKNIKIREYIPPAENRGRERGTSDEILRPAIFS